MTLTKIHTLVAKILLVCTVCLSFIICTQPATAGNSLPNPVGNIPGNVGGVNPGTTASGAVSPNDQGSSSLNAMADEYIFQHPEVDWLKMDARDKTTNNAIPGYVNPALIPGAGPFGTMYPPTPAVAMGWKTESKLSESMYTAGIKQLGGFNGQVNSDLKSYAQELQAGDFMARTLQYPPNVANQARAQALGQAQTMGNAMGEIAKSQSQSAIAYCAGFMKNFTVDEGNKWNRIRNGLFIPIAILLLLPGAILTQVRAMAAAGNPVLADRDTNPFEGILRSVVAIFLIPATYLVVNYGIDFSNSIIDSIAGTYHTVIGGNMYQDAFSSEIRAFPVRTPRENQGGGVPKQWPQTPIKGVADFESDYITNKIEDPSTNYYNRMDNKTDEAMPAGAVAARELSFGANAALTAGWNVLCAFQIAYLSYLFFVGPVVAALWVWPMRHFREALPNWVEGVITLCFWSLFWNTAILLMACFKGVDDSGTVITSALNFLATSSVKFAFDFAGLVKAAGQEAAKKATEKGGKASSSQAAADQGKSGARGAAGLGVDGKGGNDGANGGTSKQGCGTTNSDRQSQTLANTVASSSSASWRKSDLSHVTPVSPPPMSLSSNHGLNDIHSQSVRLGNYTISGGFDEKGKPVDLLKSGSGHVIAELPRGMVDGQSVSNNGVTIKYSNNAQGSSYTLTDGSGKNHIAKISTLEAATSSPVAAGLVDTRGDATKNSIALASRDGTLFVENGGNTVVMPRTDGKGFDRFSLEPGTTSGTFNLLNGGSLSLTNQPDGSNQISLSNSINGQKETFSVKPDSTGFDVSHAVNGAFAGSTKISTDANSTTGTDLTSSAEHCVKADGGFIDTLKDGAGQKVSVQGKTPDNYGGYSMQTSRYKDGKLPASTKSSFDANDKLVRTIVPPPPADPSPKSVDPSRNILNDTKKMAADIVQGTHTGDIDYVQRMAAATGMSQSDLLSTAQQATAGDPYAQTKLMASYAAHSGDQKFVETLAGSSNMTVPAVQAIAPQVASGNSFAQTKLMSACAAQMGDNSYFNQIAAATNMPVADVQQLTRDAAGGNVFAQTKLTTAHALQSGDNNFFSQIADATKMTVPGAQTLAREATTGNIYAQTQLAAANAMQNPDANFNQQIAVSTKQSMPEAQGLTQRAAQGDVYAGTQLMAAAVQFPDSNFANQVASATNLSTPGVQALIREAACGNIPAQTRLLSAYAAESSDPTLLNKISEYTQLSMPQTQALTRDAASGHSGSEARVMSAFATNSSQLVNQISSATGMPAPLIENLTRQAAHGNVYAETRLASSFSSSGHQSTYRYDQPFITGTVGSNYPHVAAPAAVHASWAADASTAVYASVAAAASTTNYASSTSAPSTSNYVSSGATPAATNSSFPAATPGSATNYPSPAIASRNNYASPAAAAPTNHSISAAPSASVTNYASHGAGALTNNYASAAVVAATNNHASADSLNSSSAQASASINYESPSAAASATNYTVAGAVASRSNYSSHTPDASTTSYASLAADSSTTGYASAGTTTSSSAYVTGASNTIHDSRAADTSLMHQIQQATAAASQKLGTPIHSHADNRLAPAEVYAYQSSETSHSTEIRQPGSAQTTAHSKDINSGAAQPPVFFALGKEAFADEEIYFGAVADSAETGESLEKQLIDAGNANQSFQRSKTIGEVLKGASPPANQLDALTDAHINYTTLCSLLNRGLKYQAQQLINVIDRDIEMLSHNAQALPLIESYIELLSRYQMIEQANAFQNHLRSAVAVDSSPLNLW